MFKIVYLPTVEPIVLGSSTSRTPTEYEVRSREEAEYFLKMHYFYRTKLHTKRTVIYSSMHEVDFKSSAIPVPKYFLEVVEV